MIKLDLVGDRIVITALATERDLVTCINGLTAKGSGRWESVWNWPVAVDAASTVQLRKGEITPEFVDKFKAEKAAQAARAAAKHGDGEPRQLGNVTLYSGQVADAEWLVAGGGSGFVFSKMRTGKSNTMYETLNILNAFPALIVCPPGITFEHERSLRQAFPDKKIAVLSNGMTPAKRSAALKEGADIVVLGYNLLAKHGRVTYFGGLKKDAWDKEVAKGLDQPKELNEYGFKAVIADEAHAVKNPTSQQTRALWALGDKVMYRLAATGTPASKPLSACNVDISDLWALLRFMYPESFPAKSKFLSKYLLMVPNYFGIMECHGLRPENEQYWKMVWEPMFLRRQRSIGTVQDIRVIPVELEKKQLKAYQQMEKEALTEFGDELLFAPEALTARHRLVQIAAGTPVVEDNKVVALNKPSPKVDTLIEWLEESDDKAIVFTDSVPMFNLVEDELLEQKIKHVSFPGGLSNEQKLKVVDSFRDDPSVKVILCSLRAANAGIDMSAATRMIFVTLSDDPVTMQQAADRNLGPTQEAASVEVAYLVGKDTVEERILESFFRKRENNQRVVGDS